MRKSLFSLGYILAASFSTAVAAAPIYTGEASLTFNNVNACGTGPNESGANYGTVPATMFISNTGQIIYSFDITVFNNYTEQVGGGNQTYVYPLYRTRRILLSPNSNGTFNLAYNPVFAMNNLTYSGANSLGTNNSYFTMYYTSNNTSCSLQVQMITVKAGD